MHLDFLEGKFIARCLHPLQEPIPAHTDLAMIRIADKCYVFALLRDETLAYKQSAEQIITSHSAI